MKSISGFLLLLVLILPHSATALEKLPDKYLVTFGDPDAPIKVIEYYSFQCPHCIALFRSDFKRIHSEYINSKEVHWTFHPIPTDLATVQGLVCMSNLSETQKRLYLEAILEETEIGDPSITALMMIKAMKLFEKPLPKLQDQGFLENTDAFLDAFMFLKQGEEITAVPTIEVNSKLYQKEVPDFDFIKSIVKKERGNS
ncbi:MAG: thioredoxin domain-containing protein [Chlamydiales bacterium]